MSLILIKDVDIPHGCCWADENRKWHLCFYHDQCKTIHELMNKGKLVVDGKPERCPMTEVYDIGELTVPAEEGAWEQGGRIYSTYKPISLKFPKWKAVSPDTFIGEKTE